MKNLEKNSNIICLVQARFGSKRFRGKVLKKFRGKSMLFTILNNISRSGLSIGQIFVVTSNSPDDDMVAQETASKGFHVYRGSLENVWSRFRDVSTSLSADWVIRICADSPLLPPLLIKSMINHINPNLDLITNTYPRTFPRGQSVEIIHHRLFRDAEFHPKTDEDREHVTSHLYRIPGIRILNHMNPKGDQSSLKWSVEEPGDIERLEKLCVE